MATQKAIKTTYEDSTVVWSNLRNKKGIPILSENESYSATKVTTWYDGTPMTDEKADGLVWFKEKESGEFFRANLPNWGETFLEKNTMDQMRGLSPTELLLLKAGYYKGVKLNGYYTKGDTPAPIEYYLSDTANVDDGGSVIEVGSIKLGHVFGDVIDAQYFGVKADGVTDDLIPLQKARDYVEARADSRFVGLTFKTGGKLRCLSDKPIVLTDSFTTSKIIDIEFSDILYTGTRDRTVIEILGAVRRTVKIGVLTAPLPAVLSNDNFKGLVIKNSLRCVVEYKAIRGFTTNYELLADGNGCAWINTYGGENHLSLNHNVITSINNGWPNANAFYNVESASGYTGQLQTSSVAKDRAYIRIKGDGVYIPNTIFFNNCHFEGGNNKAYYNGYTTDLVVIEIPISIFEINASRIEFVNDDRFGLVHKLSTQIKLDLKTIGTEQQVYDLDGVLFPIRRDGFFTNVIKTPNIKDNLKIMNTPSGTRRRYSWFDSFNYANAFNYHYSGQGVAGVTLKVTGSPVINFKTPTRAIIVLLDENKNIITDDAILNKQTSSIVINPDQMPRAYFIATYGSYKSINANNEAPQDMQMKIVPEAHYVFIGTTNNEGCIEINAYRGDVNKIELSSVKDNSRYNSKAFQIAETVDNVNLAPTDFKIGEEYVNVVTGVIYSISGLSPLRFLTNYLPPNASTTVKGLVNQSASLANISQTDLVAVSSADTVADVASTATDVAGVVTDLNDLISKYNVMVTLVNELKTKYNLNVTLTNAIKTSQNTELDNQRTAGQQSAT